MSTGPLSKGSWLVSASPRLGSATSFLIIRCSWHMERDVNIDEIVANECWGMLGFLRFQHRAIVIITALEFPACLVIVCFGVPILLSGAREFNAEVLVWFTCGFLSFCLDLSSVNHALRLIERYKRLRALPLAPKRQDLEGIGSEKND